MRPAYPQEKTRQLRSASLLLSLLLLTGMSAQVTPLLQGRTLTIDQALELALQNNESLLAAKTELERADAQIKGAISGALPKLDLGGNYTRNLKTPEVVFGGESFKLGTDNTVDLGVMFTQTLYEGGRVFTAWQIAKLYRKHVSEMVREAEGDITFGVRQAYLGTILARDFVEVFEDAVKTAELNLQVVTRMQEQGLVSEYERLRAEVELANLKPQLIKARNQASVAEDNLKNSIGVDLRESLDLTYEFDSTLAGQRLDIERLDHLAGKNRALIKEQEHLTEITKKAVSIASAGYRPNLNFSTSYGWRFQADNLRFREDDWTPSWTASLNLSMPIFDGFRTSSEVRLARADYNANQHRFEQIKDQVALQVRESHLNYQETSERLVSQSKTVAQAEEGLRIARLRYESGVGTQLEVLSAETALTQAKTNYVQARNDAALAIYRLLRVVGVDKFEQLKEQ